MARHNPILRNDSAFTQDRGGYAGFGTDRSSRDPYSYGQSGQYGQSGPYGQQAPQQGQSTEDLEAMYQRPSATGHDTGRMTMTNVMNATTATLGLVILMGLGIGMLPTVGAIALGDDGFALGQMVQMGAMLIGVLGGFVLGLVNAFKKEPSAALVLAYAAFQGMFLGGISSFFETQYSGIVIQAIGATFAVAATVLVLYRMGILRTSPRLTKIVMVAMVAYLLFSLVNIGFMIFGGTNLRFENPLLGLAVGAIAVLLASYCLVMDFEDIERGVKNGVPQKFAWRCAFGLAVTLIWLYIEILRIIA
ncbi:MAG: Bax inhibitor-1/YccA family protein, partial [Brachybacterium sp.]|nr:Bax inhibitor-1/YccA family protein [Brachybacterium sp.]